MNPITVATFTAIGGATVTVKHDEEHCSFDAICSRCGYLKGHPYELGVRFARHAAETAATARARAHAASCDRQPALEQAGGETR